MHRTFFFSAAAVAAFFAASFLFRASAAFSFTPNFGILTLHQPARVLAQNKAHRNSNGRELDESDGRDGSRQGRHTQHPIGRRDPHSLPEWKLIQMT